MPHEKKETPKKKEPWVKPADPNAPNQFSIKKLIDFLFGQEALRKAAEQAAPQGKQPGPPRSAAPMPGGMPMGDPMGANPAGPFGGGPFGGGAGGNNPVLAALAGGGFAKRPGMPGMGNV